MHELSIALTIVEIAEEEVKKAGLTSVGKIVLEIGNLAGVETEALAFAWQEAVKQTVLEKAEYLVEHTTGSARCLSCNSAFELAFIYDCCPCCGGFRKELLQGKEIRIKSLEIL
ncbi:hydrogenase maturation nickel metallochaperone HypA/HybF [Botryobacter ruber]|uniref:hydrogenase maturation nickel metallochaperone HypA/HybF n=1 Tax=Botryobacter ruber TaxID=2171629 RepID=UPI0013E2C73B|nr:hydrogenase maturation nickel metallochaperone HypA [Botryobacter ruber]